MADEKPGVFKTLTDGQMLTERKMGRRSFLAASGAFLLGAAALATGASALTQASDPDSKPKASDPDSKKAKASDTDTADKKKKKMHHKKKKAEKASDPDQGTANPK